MGKINYQNDPVTHMILLLPRTKVNFVQTFMTSGYSYCNIEPSDLRISGLGSQMCLNSGMKYERTRLIANLVERSPSGTKQDYRQTKSGTWSLHCGDPMADFFL